MTIHRKPADPTGIYNQHASALLANVGYLRRCWRGTNELLTLEG